MRVITCASSLNDGNNVCLVPIPLLSFDFCLTSVKRLLLNINFCNPPHSPTSSGNCSILLSVKINHLIFFPIVFMVVILLCLKEIIESFVQRES